MTPTPISKTCDCGGFGEGHDSKGCTRPPTLAVVGPPSCLDPRVVELRFVCNYCADNCSILGARAVSRPAGSPPSVQASINALSTRLAAVETAVAGSKGPVLWLDVDVEQHLRDLVERGRSASLQVEVASLRAIVVRLENPKDVPQPGPAMIERCHEVAQVRVGSVPYGAARCTLDTPHADRQHVYEVPRV